MSVMSAGFVDETYTAEEFRDQLKASPEASAFQQLHRAAVLCNGVTFDSATADLPLENREVNGDATDGAILRFVEH
ncbi:hypothetical protein C0993_007227, partial [Termitomyces sp. T159_Od127]